ncbi:site-specific DNA-methyltransferase [Bacteroides acidifaciens]|uniref:site-specific DNA-methyltransferase n=1 Tax=Bacteroides acidifaciens TaxID=85831 RepID=UPI00259707E1|nr:site-specific DNA-methyltransferase [Bacteroides acidifaciens]
MDKLKMKSRDVVGGNVEKIAALFPHCVTERIGKDGNAELAIDFDKLRAELSKDVLDEGEERYQFTWPDKRAASRLANEPVNLTLRPYREDSVGKDGTPGGFDSENLYIEGDNLDVLKVLRETYLGRVKMIYIDPPYNTGNEFVYNDDFAESYDGFLEACQVYDENGNLMFDPKANGESNGRFHTDWLNMIYPRLKVARDFLTEDGVIFISIDENEVENLKRLCDEIFGAKNFIAELIWSAGRKNDSKYISVSHEYILCYFRNADYIKENKIIWREKKQGLKDIYTEYERLKKLHGTDFKAIEKDLKVWFKALPDGHPAKDHSHYNRVDTRGIFFADNISWPGGGGPKYEVLHPITGKPVTVPSRGWITNKENLQRWIDDDRVLFGETEKNVPTIKAYLKEREFAVPYSVFYKDGRAASKRLATLMGDKMFENPKDEEIIQRIIEFCGVKDGDIVMDFFSGSGTTAQSVFLASINKKIKIKFILVQLRELISEDNATAEKGKKVARAAIALCDELGVPHNICEIAKERIRRAGKKAKEDAGQAAGNLDIGFRVLKLDSSNMEDVFYTPENFEPSLLDGLVDNIKPDRSGEDLLFQVMLDLGIELSAKIEQKEIAGKKVFSVDDDYLLACFDTDVNETTIEEMAKLLPTHLVIRDASAANDNVLDNFDQIIESYSNEKKITTHIL